MKTKHGYYDVFVRTCAKYPSNIAIREYYDGEYKYYTYSELYGVCEYVAQNIQQIKCIKGIIGIITERNPIIPCVIAATHRCSTTFMFIDPTQDGETIIKNAKINIVLEITHVNTNETNKLKRQPEKTFSIFDLEINIYIFDHESNTNCKINEHSYIAMTSGSTGDPKFILVPIQCIQPNIEDLKVMFEINHNDVIYFSTPLTFDPSMIEILLACVNGASLLIAPENADILFPNNNKNSITFWQTTPSKFFHYSTADIKNRILSAKSTLKILALGGEPMNGIRRLKELKSLDNGTKIFTLYGVTEMSCWACVAELDLDKITTDREIPLGNCLSETQLVLEKSNKSTNIGKIVLGSKTRQCSILNKYTSNEPKLLQSVNTGDIGEVKNGTIYYRGRKDDIIKRFGCKVSLLSIENTIMQCPRVKTCSCVWLPKPMLLVVYFSSETLNSQELGIFLKCKLDDRHWPDNIIRVDNLPMSAHGKKSKKTLSEMSHEKIYQPRTINSMRTLFMKELRLFLNGNFKYEDIKDKDFFSIGGTSFLAVAMCNKLSTSCPEFGKTILPYLLNQKCTINFIIEMASKAHNEIRKITKKLKRTISNASCSVSTAKSCKTEEAKKPFDYKVVWQYNTGKCVDASPTLFKDGLNIYVCVGSHSGKVVVVDALSGLHRSLEVKSRVEASVVCTDILGSPRGVVGTYDGTIVCFTLRDCSVLWKINIGSMVKSKGAYLNGCVYVAAYDGNISCIDIMTGKINEIMRIDDQAISADLVIAKNEFLLVGSLSGVCACVHLASGSQAWRGSLASPVFASPVLYDGDKFVVFAEVNGEIHCRTVEKGIKIWKYQGAKGNIFSSMYFKRIDKLKWQMVFGCHDRSVYCVVIKNYQPSLQWKAQLTSPVYSTPCNFGKFVLATSNNGIMCLLDADSGSVVSQHRLPNESFSSPAVAGDYIFVGCRDDCLYCIKCLINT